MSVRDLIPQNWTGWRNRDSRLPAAWREGGRDPFASLHREMDRAFDDFFRAFDTRLPALSALGASGGGWPSVEVAETDGTLTVSAELPGLDDKDVEVLLEDGQLTIQGERVSTTEDKDRQFSERFYGRFERRIPLPPGIDAERVEAGFRNGVLTVTLPRTEAAQAQVRRIPLKG